MIDQKGGKGLEKRRMYQNPLLNTKMAIITYFSVQSGILVQLLLAS